MGAACSSNGVQPFEGQDDEQSSSDRIQLPNKAVPVQTAASKSTAVLIPAAGMPYVASSADHAASAPNVPLVTHAAATGLSAPTTTNNMASTTPANKSPAMVSSSPARLETQINYKNSCTNTEKSAAPSSDAAAVYMPPACISSAVSLVLASSPYPVAVAAVGELPPASADQSATNTLPPATAARATAFAPPLDKAPTASNAALGPAFVHEGLQIVVDAPIAPAANAVKQLHPSRAQQAMPPPHPVTAHSYYPQQSQSRNWMYHHEFHAPKVQPVVIDPELQKSELRHWLKLYNSGINQALAYETQKEPKLVLDTYCRAQNTLSNTDSLLNYADGNQQTYIAAETRAIQEKIQAIEKELRAQKFGPAPTVSLATSSMYHPPKTQKNEECSRKMLVQKLLHNQ